MKKTTLLVFPLLLTATAIAQQVRVGVKGGLNVANEKIKSSFSSRKATTISSFHGGFILDVPLTGNLYLQPQLMLSGKGSRDGSFDYRPFYAELPLNLVYKYEVNNGLKIYGGLGPGIGIGIMGNVRNVDTRFTRNLKFGETTNSDYKTVDFTGGFELGAEINQLALGLGYRWSFLDVTMGSAKVTHKVVNFSVAYYFGGTGGKGKGSKSSSRATRKRR